MRLRTTYRNAIPVGIVTVLAPLGFAAIATAENLDHMQRLLSTRQCFQCDLSNAGLVFAKLSNANLGQANLSGANLSRADLQGADLRGANLAGATLFGANLSGAKLDGAILQGADLRNTYLAGATLDSALMEGALLQGAVGLSSSAGSADDFYRWAMEDTQQNNFPRAIEHFTQAINRKSDLAPAYLGRAYARSQTGDKPGAIEDSKKAQSLFAAQGDAKSADVAQTLVKELEAPPPKARSGRNFGETLLTVLGGLLQFFLRF